MEGFYLLCGHLLGDYILQNDWQAANKTNPLVGSRPNPLLTLEELETARRSEVRGHLACTVHCLLYTLSVAAFSFWWMPWWGYLACFALHWPMDRFRLARVWMERVSGQKAFACGLLSPWSVIIVDNVFHLLTLAGIAAIAGR